MADLLVNLYDLPNTTVSPSLAAENIRVVRAISPDMFKVVAFAQENFSDKWAGECTCAFANNPPSCFIALQNKEVIGFACYNATAKGFFGPIGIKQDKRANGLGAALLLSCLEAMRWEGYGYAIIGGGSDVKEFYQKTANAQIIPGSEPGVYARLISYAPETNTP